MQLEKRTMNKIEKTTSGDFNYLLSYGEEAIPENVILTAHFFKGRNIWFQLNRNKGLAEVLSCADAADKRHRLGTYGIPLRDELKSIIIKLTPINTYLMIHCRGDHSINFEKVLKIFKDKNREKMDINSLEISEVDKDELHDAFKMEYGLVNPFNLEAHNGKFDVDIIHVFDKSLLLNKIPPYTMMTNAGSKSWSVEFYPDEIIRSMNRRMTDSFTVDIPEAKKLTIGILTGNGPESGMFLWKEINGEIRNQLKEKCQGDIDLPNVIVESNPNMGLSMELEEREGPTRKAVLQGVSALCKRGADIVVIACNTTQYFKSEIVDICKEYDSRFIPMEEPLLNYLRERNIGKFAFLGIKYTLDQHYSGFKNLSDFDVERFSSEALNEISDLGFQVKREGITSSGINKLRQLINKNTDSSVIVIALTEITILMESQKKQSIHGKEYIDTLKLLAKYVAEYYLNNLFPDREKTMIANTTAPC